MSESVHKCTECQRYKKAHELGTCRDCGGAVLAFRRTIHTERIQAVADVLRDHNDEELTPEALARLVLAALDERDVAGHESAVRQGDSAYESGRMLYVRWCGAPGSDRGRYFDAMNPVDRRSWIRLAEELRQERERPDA